LWIHEDGFNKVLNGVEYPIHSFVQYPILDMFTTQPSGNSNCLMETLRIENDFIQQGEMTCQVYNWMYANTNIDPILSNKVKFTINTPFIDNIICQGRLTSVRFDSWTVDGYFACGKILQDIIPGDYNI
jgi:hypothetical protein